MDQVLYGIDYIEYYFYWIYYKFIGYPLIIRICSIAVMFCIIMYLFLLFHITYGIFKRRKEKKKYNKAFDKYYEEMKAISLDPNALPEEEIADRLKYDTRKRPRPNELRIITQLLTEIKSVHEDEINELNYQTIQTVFQITRFLERELQFGSKRSKIQALKLIRFRGCIGTFPLSPRIRVEELCTIYLYVVKPGKPVPFLRRRYCHEVETMGHDGVARYSGAP